MAGGDILKHLLRAYKTSDHSEFRRAALQLAAQESKAGHTKLADEIRKIIGEFPTTDSPPAIMDIAKPRGELADLMEGGFCRERLQDIILSNPRIDELERIIRENRQRNSLEQWGVSSRRKLLLIGPPGCGKTLAARVLAGELTVPLLTVKFDALFSRYLGSTANHLRTIFDEMARKLGVFLFDEFDALASHRGESSDVGEVKRVVSSFLQLMDSDKSNSLIIAATNYADSIDRAVIRRFDLVIEFPRPTKDQMKALIVSRLGTFKVPASKAAKLASKLNNASFADCARACDDSIRNMVLAGRDRLEDEDLNRAFTSAGARHGVLKRKGEARR